MEHFRPSAKLARRASRSSSRLRKKALVVFMPPRRTAKPKRSTDSPFPFPSPPTPWGKVEFFKSLSFLGRYFYLGFPGCDRRSWCCGSCWLCFLRFGLWILLAHSLGQFSCVFGDGLHVSIELFVLEKQSITALVAEPRT